MPGIDTAAMFRGMTLDVIMLVVGFALLVALLWLIYRSGRDIADRDRLIGEQQAEINLLHHRIVQTLMAQEGSRDE